MNSDVNLKRWEEKIDELARFNFSEAQRTSGSNDDESLMWEYWLVVKRHRFLILTTVLIVVTLATILSLRMTKQYEAVGRIAINKENSDVLGFKDSAGGGGDDYDYNVMLDTQVQVLTSDSLAASVIKSLHLDGNLRYSPRTLSESNPGQAYPLKQKVSYGALVAKFHNNLKVEKVPRTRIVMLRYLSPDPQLSADVVNSLVSNFIDYNFNTKFQSSMQTSEWLSRQLSDLQLKVSTSQQRLVEYQKENGILGLDDKQNIVTSKLSELNQQLTQAQGDRIQKEAVYRLSLVGNLDSLPPENKNDVIDHLRDQERDLQSKLAELSSQYGPEHPKVITTEDRLKQVQVSLRAEYSKVGVQLKNQYLTALQRERMLQAALDVQKQEANRLNESAIQYDILKHEADSNRQLYEGLLQKMKEANVSAGLRSGNIQIVDPAVRPARPAKPNVPLNIALAFFVSLTFATGVAFALERLDNSVSTPELVNAISRWPSLGVIPSTLLGESGKKSLPGDSDSAGPRRSSLVVVSRPRSKVAESFRAVRTSILLSSPELPPKVLMVTSGLPEEGKTTISVNVAGVLAQRGERVLLVDADMRRSRIHEVLNLDGSKGLSSVLEGTCTLEEATVSNPDVASFYVLPAGPHPLNPAELLGSSAMKALIQTWRKQYDHVVIDTPPVLTVTDAVLLSAEADAVLVVVRFGSTTKKALREVRSVLSQVNARIMGVIMNSVDVDLNTYGYGYYKGYGAYPENSRYYHEDAEEPAVEKV